MTSIAALLTSHNRRDTTLRSLRELKTQKLEDDVTVRAYVVDAGSSDGTAAAIAEEFGDDVEVIRGTSDLFWNQGMRRAWARARTDGHDHYLWLNDDTVLDDDAVATLLNTAEAMEARLGQPAIIVGCSREPGTDTLSYGGVSRPNPASRPLAFDMIQPGPEPVEVEAMNGNVVLVPAEIAGEIGNLDPAFTHAMGDYDYGLRARRAGYSVWMAPGMVASCPRNAPPDPRRSVGDELKRLRGPKGIPPSEWRVFAQRWAGPAWPIFWASPYVRAVIDRIRNR